MKTFLWIALGLGVVAGLFLLVGQLDTPTATHEPDYQSIIDKMLQDDRPAIALRITTPKFEISETRGYVDWENEIPLQQDHLLRIASCTKTFIATLTLIQHFEGKLDLDDVITEYLPESIASRIQYADQITIRQLLNHTSGIFNTGDNPEYWAAQYGDPTREWTDTEVLGFALDQPANFEPGTGYAYSNTDYLLAGLILDQVLGHHHSADVRSRILEPLELRSTFYEQQEPFDRDMLSHGYFDFDGDGIAEDYYGLRIETGRADGGLVSTADDLATFLAALATRRDFPDAKYKEQFMQELLTIQPASGEPGQIGTGPGIAEYDYGYGPTYGHSGGIPGYVSLMLYFAAHDVTFAMTWNGFDGGFADFGMVPALYEALIEETFIALGIESTLADEGASDENVYVDPAGLLTMPLIGDWTPVETDGTYAKYAYADMDLAMSLVTIEASDAEGDLPAALASIGIDPALLTETYRGNWNKWSIFYYHTANGEGVTVLGQVQDGVGYYVIATGDPDLTGNPPEDVMKTLGGFALSGEIVLPATVGEFESYVNEIVGLRPPALSIAIATADDIIYAQGFGMADRPEGVQANADTVYFWGSITKTVTATAIMQLREQGLVDLDAPISDYLDYFPAQYGITVWNLLTHSSGLPEPDEWLPRHLRLQGQPLPDADAMDREYYAELEDLMFEPGTTSAYANPDFVTLGQIVEAVSGQPYVEYVRGNILIPLGMETTDFEYSTEAMVANAAAPATSLSNRDAMITIIDDARGLGDAVNFFRETDDDTAWMNHFIVGEAAGGGLMGSATDMVRYGQMLVNGGELNGVRVLSPESVELLRQEQFSSSGEPLGFGMAWLIRDDSEHPYIEHGGGGEGVDALLRVYLDDGFAIALQANSGGYSRQEMMNAAANVVITMLGGGPPPADAQGPPTDLPPEEALQGLLDQQVAEQGLLGMAMSVRMTDGAIIHKVSGFTDPEGLDAWSSESLTGIGSITKTFTAVLIMQLVEEGKISLDDTVDAWFPDLSRSDDISIRMLLSHTSGIANYITGENVMSGKWNQKWSPSDLVNEAISLGFVAEPGSEDAHYSNTAYIMLGMIIEAITENTWSDELSARILEPLGMYDTTFLSADGVLDRMIGGYGKTDEGFANAKHEAWYPHPSTVWSAGEIVTTVSDLTLFASALFDGDLVSRESLGIMATPLGHEDASGRDWGLGGAVITEGDMVAFGMGGDIPGFHAFFIGVLDTEFVVAAACNTQGGDVITPSLGALQYIMGAVVGSAEQSAAVTPPIVDADGNVIPGSIATMGTVTLGGVEQSITIRGVDVANPVLLILHGGPGTPTSAWATWNGFHVGLEEEFVVVHWDQRGTGLSYSANLTADDMHVEDFVSDTLELANLLREQFGQERIFLFGHSWGSGLGFETLRVDSEPFYAFIASAVRPDWDSTQRLSYEKVLGIALRERDADAISALEALHPFDPSSEEHRSVKSQYMTQFLVGDFRTEGLEDEWLEYVFSDSSPEHPAAYIDQTVAGMDFSHQTIGTEVATTGYDHVEDFPVSEIPIYFIHGRYDFECPGELAEIYYEALRAPMKGFIWFENSAHDVLYDEPDAFNQEMIRIANEVLATVPVAP